VAFGFTFSEPKPPSAPVQNTAYNRLLEESNDQ
jgi:hypothetical protein